MFTPTSNERDSASGEETAEQLAVAQPQYGKSAGTILTRADDYASGSLFDHTNTVLKVTGKKKSRCGLV